MFYIVHVVAYLAMAINYGCKIIVTKPGDNVIKTFTVVIYNSYLKKSTIVKHPIVPTLRGRIFQVLHSRVSSWPYTQTLD